MLSLQSLFRLLLGSQRSALLRTINQSVGKHKTSTSKTFEQQKLDENKIKGKLKVVSQTGSNNKIKYSFEIYKFKRNYRFLQVNIKAARKCF